MQRKQPRPPIQGLIPERIRNRRREQGMAGFELAEKVGISASYISLIEKGAKVPSETIAEKIARALGDEPGLYRSWAQSARVTDLETSLSDVQQLKMLSSDPKMRDLLTSGANLKLPRKNVPQPKGDETIVQEIGDEAEPAGSERMIAVPVFAEGADPGAEPESSDLVEDTLNVDRRSLPPGNLEPLFAYRISKGGFTGVRDQLSAGDLVVLTTVVGRVATDRVYAVRHDGAVVLSRVLLKEGTLLLLPPEGSHEFEVLKTDKNRPTPSLIAGRVILTIKRW